MVEQTLILIKPDAINHFSEILQRFKNNGFRVLDIKYSVPAIELVEKHYHKVFLEHPEYRPSVIEYITSGSLAAIVLEGENAVQRARQLIGPLTNAPAGTIRGDLRTDQSDPLHTLVHGSDSSESAVYEINLWFPGKFLFDEREIIKSCGLNRRDFIFSFSVLSFGLSFATMNGSILAEVIAMDSKERREFLFVQAIACQRNGNTNEALQRARECLGLLKNIESLEESATSRVSVEVMGQSILLPNLLHTDTALLHFRFAGIDV